MGSGRLLGDRAPVLPGGGPALVRSVRVRNRAGKNVDVCATAGLYPNSMVFDEYAMDRKQRVLTASGYHHLRMFSPDATPMGDRYLDVRFGGIPAESQR